MPAQKRLKQLKLGIDALQDQYNGVFLHFRLGYQIVEGVLNGSAADWTFQSYSRAFLKQVPTGTLYKYMLWMDSVPPGISNVYNAIEEAAFKAGYDMIEREEWA